MTSRYTKLTIAELEAEISAAQCALDAKRREYAMETLMQIDGPFYGDAA